jgi:extracellular solute-binding protein family 3
MGRVAALLLTLSLMALTASCRKSGAADEHTIRLAYLPISHALPVIETASDPELRVELIRYGSWPELMDALITGRVDGASVLIELAMRARERGAPLTAVALGHRRGNVIVAGAGVASAEALRGRVFAIPHRNSSHYLLFRSLLEQHGLQPSEVQVVELSPSEMPSALFTG